MTAIINTIVVQVIRKYFFAFRCLFLDLRIHILARRIKLLLVLFAHVHAKKVTNLLKGFKSILEVLFGLITALLLRFNEVAGMFRFTKTLKSSITTQLA